MLRDYVISEMKKVMYKDVGKKVLVHKWANTMFPNITDEQQKSMEQYKEEILDNFHAYGFEDYFKENLLYCNPKAFYLGVISVSSMFMWQESTYLYDNWDKEITITKQILDNLFSVLTD